MGRKKDTEIRKVMKKIGRSNPERLKKPLLITLLVFVAGMVFFVNIINRQIQELDQLAGDSSENNIKLKTRIKSMTEGYPINEMTNYIARKDEKLAAYLIAIAKKESDWGKRVPVLDGKNCYNYWGYRGIRQRMGSGGHTCFNSPKDAIDTVSRRLAYFVFKKNMETPRDMVVWKCGGNCDLSVDSSAKKWVQDVSWYYQKVLE